MTELARLKQWHQNRWSCGWNSKHQSALFSRLLQIWPK